MRSERSPTDANNPPDSPIMLGGAQPPSTGGTANIPLEAQRELEASLRISEKLSLQRDAYRNAEQDATVVVGLQVMWLTCGMFVARRGYRFADPIRSWAKPYTDNAVLCKLANPFTVLGSLMAGVTAYQLPRDVRFWLEARTAVQKESARLQAVVEGRKEKLAALGIHAPRSGGHPEAVAATSTKGTS